MSKELYIRSLNPIYSSKHLVVYKPDENGIMFLDWSGFLKATFIKEDCIAILDCLEKYPTTKILNSNLKVTGHYAGAAEWLGKIWLHLLHDRGVQYFSWVYSPEFYSEIGADQVISYNTSLVGVQTFYSLDSAYIWLLNCY